MRWPLPFTFFSLVHRRAGSLGKNKHQEQSGIVINQSIPSDSLLTRIGETDLMRVLRDNGDLVRLVMDWTGSSPMSRDSLSVELNYQPTRRTLDLFISLLGSGRSSGLVTFELRFNADMLDNLDGTDTVLARNHLNGIVNQLALSNSVREVRFEGLAIGWPTLINMLNDNGVRGRLLTLSLLYTVPPDIRHFGLLPTAIRGLTNLQELVLPWINFAGRLRNCLASAAQLTRLRTLKLKLADANQARALRTHFVEGIAHRSSITIVVYETELDKGSMKQLIRGVRALGRRRADFVFEGVSWHATVPRPGMYKTRFAKRMMAAARARNVSLYFDANCEIGPFRTRLMNRIGRRN